MIISIASGKGGTGKTLVATSLAFSLKDKYRVQVLDCDVEEPNDHIFLRPTITAREKVCIPVPKIDESNCTHGGKCGEVCAYHAIAVFPENILVFPHLCHGCGACSYFCPVQAITEEDNEIGSIESGYADGIDFIQGKLNIGEVMPVPVIREMKKHIDCESISILDCSPGTSCPVVESIKNSDFCLLVTEPTPFGLNDLILAVETVKILDVPCGVIINRTIAGMSQLNEFCLKEKIPVFMTIPLNTEVAYLYSKGITMAEAMVQWKKNFIMLYDRVQERVNERNRCLKR